MTTAKELLSMIEAVDPDDTAKLDEIDAHVYVFLRLHAGFRTHVCGGSITYRHESWPDEQPSVLYHCFDNHRYSRSRDALKGIRPDGWAISSEVDADGCTLWMTKQEAPNPQTNGPRYFKTEELAELHAIIQAIAYERGEG